MFYCDPCRVDKGWPETFYKSRGRCEVCESTAVCNDKPAKHLPISTPVIDDTSFWW